jgi:hypothetical protein
MWCEVPAQRLDRDFGALHHRILIAKNVVHHYEIGESWDFGN